MQISRKADYAIRAMIYVAALNGRRTCSINEIAAKEKIPREYLAKILKELTQKGFLLSYKGVNGGYKLAKSRDTISFLDLLEAAQGPFVLSSYNQDFRNEPGGKGKEDRPSFAFWDGLHKKLKANLSDMHLGKIEYEKFYKFDR
jgi:Rrf2 family protein